VCDCVWEMGGVGVKEKGIRRVDASRQAHGRYPAVHVASAY
jgi:hypothetical protein